MIIFKELIIEVNCLNCIEIYDSIDFKLLIWIFYSPKG